MSAPQFSAKLRLPLLALILSILILFYYVKTSSFHNPKDWSSSSEGTVAQTSHSSAEPAPGAEAGADLLFDHTPHSTPPSPGKHPLDPPSKDAAPAPPPRRKRNAIVTAIWDESYASLALMLGHSIKKHNNLDDLDAELVLLTLQPDKKWTNGLTSWNRTILSDYGGFTIRSEPILDFPGVNMTAIQWHRRLNLNKLKIFGWDQYERILFIDADCIVTGPLDELFDLPRQVEFAAAPDAWPQVEVDPRFNSGVMVFRPSQNLLKDMVSKLADKNYHDPTEGDQQFLQNYWKYRDWKLPLKFNLNLVHFVWRKKQVWDAVWPETRILHLTVRKPREWWKPGGYCENPVTKPPKIGPNECAEIPVLKWYKGKFEEMRRELKLENEIGILG